MDLLTVEHPLIVRNGRLLRPANHLLSCGKKIGSQRYYDVPALVVPCSEEIAVEIKNWADATLSPAERVRLFGCFEVAIHQVRIERSFVGVTAYCASFADAVQIKLTWG